MRIFLLLLLIAFVPAIAFADITPCGGEVDHVLIESGREHPTPDYVVPDVGEYAETPQQEWNYLNNENGSPSITVHCFPTKGTKSSVDVALPRTIKKCVFAKGILSCR